VRRSPPSLWIHGNLPELIGEALFSIPLFNEARNSRRDERFRTPRSKSQSGPGMVSFSAGQEAARRLLEGSQRYTCLAGGTRSGKTFLIVRAIVMRALQEKGSRHAILRFRANAARASIALGTLSQVVQLCFPGMLLKEHRRTVILLCRMARASGLGDSTTRTVLRKSLVLNMLPCS